MKELTIEEKAKAYDEALKNARYYHSEMEGDVCCVLEECFPKLKESEDKRIRKALIKYLDTLNDNEIRYGVSFKDMHTWLEKQCEPIDREKVLIGARRDIALSIMNFLDRNTFGMCLSNMECVDLESAVVDSDWSKVYDYMKKKLEKQSEQKEFTPKSAIETIKEITVDNKNCAKHIDKVEPRFHEGDWVIFNNRHDSVYQIEKIENYEYTLRHFLDGSMPLSFSSENMIRAWTIQDVKDGDVICDDYLIILFKKWEVSYDHNFVFAHAGIDINGDLQIVNEHCHIISNKIKPATAEKREFLFAKMKEAGYQWDTDKKELKKIEFRPSQWDISDFRTWQYIVCDVLTKHDGIGQYLDDGFCKKIAQYMQNEWSNKLCSVQNLNNWSEEDEGMWIDAIKYLELFDAQGIHGNKAVPCINWLKSLKQRIGG